MLSGFSMWLRYKKYIFDKVEWTRMVKPHIQRLGYICFVFMNYSLIYNTLYHKSIGFEDLSFDFNIHALIRI